MLQTTILISPAGPASLVGLFLPPGASIIVNDFPSLKAENTFLSEHSEGGKKNYY